ncbi:MAG: hypothetical protein KDJ77_03565 [Rhodobiaceae bacterium]|nr:hypothetical protein [Rhodobiaceae bacterium]
MLSLPPRHQLIIALIIAGVFALPPVTLISMLVVFPILFYGALAIYVNLGVFALPVAYALHRYGIHSTSPQAWHKWILAAIVWTGCSIGFANWGTVGSAIGARNTPLVEVFFAPVVMLVSQSARLMSS